MEKVAKAAALVRNANVFETRGEADTIKLWESYRDQAVLWRSLSLLQIPATILTAALALYLAQTRAITLDVPQKPLPGLYAVQEIPDSEFINSATSFINLIATYQPNVAKRQFNAATEVTTEPFLSKFKEEMLQEELKTIETTNRTQIFFADPLQTKLERNGRKDVVVTMRGERLKLIAGEQIPAVRTKYVVTMETIPQNKFNPYGIVITDLQAQNVESIHETRKERKAEEEEEARLNGEDSHKKKKKKHRS